MSKTPSPRRIIGSPSRIPPSCKAFLSFLQRRKPLRREDPGRYMSRMSQTRSTCTARPSWKPDGDCSAVVLDACRPDCAGRRGRHRKATGVLSKICVGPLRPARTHVPYADELPCLAGAIASWPGIVSVCARPGLYHLGGSERLSRWEIGEVLLPWYPELAGRLVKGSTRNHTGAPRPTDLSLRCDVGINLTINTTKFRYCSRVSTFLSQILRGDKWASYGGFEPV